MNWLPPKLPTASKYREAELVTGEHKCYVSKVGPSDVVQIEMSYMDWLLSHKKDLEAMKQGGSF